MCGGGTQQTTQSVSIPPDVLARYNSVNNTAAQVAQTPFQQYSTDPSAFVAPLNSTENAGISGTNAAAGQAQPYFGAATGQLMSGENAALGQYGLASGAYQNEQASGLNFNDAATGQAWNAFTGAQPYLSSANQDVGQGQQQGQQLAGLSLGSLSRAGQSAAPLNGAAGQLYGAGLATAQPLNSAANQNIAGAYAGAQPYQGLATGYATAGAQAVDPSTLSAANINQYLSPYLSTVMGNTAQLLAQNNQIEQQGALGDAIKSGAFGGDRAGIALANLAQQQQLASGNILSGIANQGYNTALGTAQQQQGLGLSAAQANRAALAGAAPEVAAIGQQGFGQGLATGQAQAGLGQTQFGEANTTGQSVQGLGSQVYGQGANTAAQQLQTGQDLFGQGLASSQQEAALGQQQYAQQMGLSQQLSDLGQQRSGLFANVGQNQQALGAGLYGVGANTSQQLAGLGTGAQSAALQGAQAQLGAGQLAQQTSQAGNTALYNQFLQQQSYPFQVAQFLANIAEGTGALSGSTTTTTQPGGFFSDARLKEGIQPIGETFDGQKIVKFRYKGEPHWRIGLIAQDVEKAHPGAVGEAHGFKTVDYGKATEDAARRGKFAYGGYASEGPDPEAMAQILSSGRGMYGPYMAGSGGPYGGAQGRVPAASLPVGQLRIAAAPPAQESLVSQLRDASEVGQDIGNAGGQAHDLWRKFNPEDPPYARGGRTGLATGGDPIPYESQEAPLSLDIPDASPKTQALPQPGKPATQRSGLDDVADIAKIAAAIAAMKRGGVAARPRLAVGGDPDDTGGFDPVEDFASPSPGGGSPDRPWYLKPIPSPQEVAGSIGHAVSSGLATASSALKAHNAEQPATKYKIGDNFYNSAGLLVDPPAPGDEYATGQTSPSLVGSSVSELPGTRTVMRAPPSAAAPPPGLAAAAPHAPHHVSRGLAARSTPQAPATAPDGGSDPSAQAPTTASPAAGLGTSPPAAVSTQPEVTPAAIDKTAPLTSTPSDLSQASDDMNPGLLKRLQNSPFGDYASSLKHGDLPTWLSLLGGLGAAGTYPTQHLGVALAAGLSGGAKAYMGAKQQQAGLAKTAAETTEQQAQAQEAQARSGYYGSLAGAVHVDSLDKLKGMLGLNGYVPVEDPKGHYEVNGVRYGFQPATSVLGADATAGPSQPASAPRYLGTSGVAMAGQAFNRFGGATPEAVKSSNENLDTVYREADDASAHVLGLNRFATSLSGNPDGLLTGGAMHDVRSEVANRWNTLMGVIGHPEAQISGLDDAQMAGKMNIGTAALSESGYGQRSAQAFKAFLQGTPGNQMQRGAALNLVSDLIEDNQRSIDKGAYFRELSDNLAGKYGAPAARNFLASDALNAFNSDWTPARYEAERNNFAKLLASPSYPKINTLLQSGDAEKRRQAAVLIDKVTHDPGFHRWYTGQRLY